MLTDIDQNRCACLRWTDGSTRISVGGSLRALTCFVHDDQTLLICVGGDKAAWAQRKTSDWYDVFVPVADAVVDLYLQENP